MIGIYMISSSMSDNVYIGQSVNVRTRFNLHLTNLRNNKHHSAHLQNAWNLYGESSFKFEIVQECEKDELTRREQAWMDEYKGRLYNSSPAAGSVTGYKHTDEAKEKIAASKRGVARHPDVVKKQRESMTGFRHTEESKAKMSAASTLAQSDSERKAATSARSKAMWAQPGFKEKRLKTMSEEARKRWEKKL